MTVRQEFTTCAGEETHDSSLETLPEQQRRVRPVIGRLAAGSEKLDDILRHSIE